VLRIFFITGLLIIAAQSQTHFEPVDTTGKPYLVIIEPDTDANYKLQMGDEIGLFADTLCVGANIYNGIGNFPITAWEGDPGYNLAGFCKGDSIIIKLWADLEEGLNEYICAVAYSEGDGTFGYGTYTVCTVDLDVTDTNSVNITGNHLPVSVSLGKNYPNPFNPVTTIPYQISEATRVSLGIYNVSGEKIVVLKNEFNPSAAGFYKVTFDASNLGSGVYFYRLETDKYKMSRKLLLIK